MIKILLPILLLFLSASPAKARKFDANEFASDYFSAWLATQSSVATKEDIKHYLHFLTDDVGHQHLPFDPTAIRVSNGKKKMLKGMLYYLGSHSEYSADLINTVVGYNVVVIKYPTHSKGKRPQSEQIVELSYDTVEVLKIEYGKVGVIRKYSE